MLGIIGTWLGVVCVEGGGGGGEGVGGGGGRDDERMVQEFVGREPALLIHINTPAGGRGEIIITGLSSLQPYFRPYTHLSVIHIFYNEPWELFCGIGAQVLTLLGNP